MTKTIDGCILDIPPVTSQIIALARYHHQQLNRAILDQKIHLGEYALKQQFQLEELVAELSDTERQQFNQVYTEELCRLAEKDQHAHAEAEKANLALIFIILAIIAVILYFTFAQRLTG